MVGVLCDVELFGKNCNLSERKMDLMEIVLNYCDCGMCEIVSF